MCVYGVKQYEISTQSQQKTLSRKTFKKTITKDIHLSILPKNDRDNYNSYLYRKKEIQIFFPPFLCFLIPMATMYKKKCAAYE